MLATLTERVLSSASTMASVTFPCPQYASGSSPATKLPRGQEQCRLQQRQPLHHCQPLAAEQSTSRLPHRNQHLATTAKLSMVLMGDNTPSAANLTQVEMVGPIGPKPSHQETSRNVSMPATKINFVAHGYGADPVAQVRLEVHASSNRRPNHQSQEVEISLLAY